MASDRLSRPAFARHVRAKLVSIDDPIAQGLRRGWHVTDASRLTDDLHLEADVAIVGTGAGGGTAGEILSAAGLKVVMIEEGPLRSSSDFHMRESEAYPQLYQESGARQTTNKAITILQGRCVGGSTTVNWMASFRTPPSTLAYWRERFGLADYTSDTLAPWFDRMERALHISPWTVTPNQNNAALARGTKALGIESGIVARNQRHCWNIGYCGMGCPTNAKQSMLVTTIPAALDRGACLVSLARANRLIAGPHRVSTLECIALDASGTRPGVHRITVSARHFVAAAGGIGSPALLLRSSLPDPHRQVGVRTFLHPTAVSSAVMPDPVDPYSGAPQSVYSDHFLHTQPLDGPIGFKLEVPPVHPLLAATTLQGFGGTYFDSMRDLPHLQVTIALLRDGFHEQSQGGTVMLKADGTPAIDYPISEYVWDGVRRALLTMAQIQFAAGATWVAPVHEDCSGYRSWTEAKSGIASLPMQIMRARVVSAHVMGGCAMGADPRTSVVDGYGRHHVIENLSVLDGSLFPTSLGANPQLSIYGIVARNASRLAAELTLRSTGSAVERIQDSHSAD
jgi:choline dehydrogenase-like flavoprotein